MKKRLISLLLAVILVLSAAPLSYAAGDPFDFMTEVNNELPEASGIFLGSETSLSKKIPDASGNSLLTSVIKSNGSPAA